MFLYQTIKATKYERHIIASDCKLFIVNKHFMHVSCLSRGQAREKSTISKSQVSKSVKLIMK